MTLAFVFVFYKHIQLYNYSKYERTKADLKNVEESLHRNPNASRTMGNTD